MFQSPSLRGSGRFLLRLNSRRRFTLFQSPSLRGSGRFSATMRERTLRIHESFNPLHCGAVVASRYAASRMPRISTSFNPLHCGAVVASRRTAGGARRKESFNPLHCGAVVASSVCNSALPAAGGRFNPLHCGAVVASDQQHRRTGVAAAVSIPFIAGQWSLPRKTGEGLINYLEFQSPSLRGSGRFMTGR